METNLKATVRDNTGSAQSRRSRGKGIIIFYYLHRMKKKRFWSTNLDDRLWHNFWTYENFDCF